MIITQTPLRISFLGGGTDFPDYYKKYGGSVISMAIDKYVYCILNLNNNLRVLYSRVFQLIAPPFL